MLADDRMAVQSGVPVSLAGVRRCFEGGVMAIDRVDLEVLAGQFLAMLGPSGCGKSTLLRIIAGLDRPDAGRVVVNGSGQEHDRPRVAYVFQDAHLLPWRNVIGNVALPLELMGADRHRWMEQAMRAIEQVGLADAQARYPAQLSGGMRMRVSLARALVTDPRLLLLDEPFAALDEITRQHLDEQLRELWKARGMTVVFVTHSISEAAFLAQRAVVLSARPARIVADCEIGLPEDRSAELRSTAAFARQTGVLFEALQRGAQAS